ncbi:MAG: galactokinase, partial [Defluviitaleaceae bacterium]|nr:galactokinase [Defluviitaleaceae bacterium]
MDILKDFADRFGASGEARVYHAPGRVNLIGEHTDYNGGHVFPCSLNFGTYAAAAPRPDSIIEFQSVNFGLNCVEVDLNMPLKYDKLNDWANYPLGVV